MLYLAHLLIGIFFIDTLIPTRLFPHYELPAFPLHLLWPGTSGVANIFQ